jgi:hypothetical protein
MRVEEVLSGLRYEQKKRENDFVGTCQTNISAMCKDVAECIESLQEETERLSEIVDSYATAARIIALYLNDYCDNKLNYTEMIADAARKANEEIKRLESMTTVLSDELDFAKMLEIRQNDEIERLSS